jgi:hypothetical protein
MDIKNLNRDFVNGLSRFVNNLSDLLITLLLCILLRALCEYFKQPVSNLPLIVNMYRL